jgi:hypothetical protein
VRKVGSRRQTRLEEKRRGVGLGMRCLWLVGRHGIHPLSGLKRRNVYLSGGREGYTNKIERTWVPLLYSNTHSYLLLFFFFFRGPRLSLLGLYKYCSGTTSLHVFFFFSFFFTLRHPSFPTPLSFVQFSPPPHSSLASLLPTPPSTLDLVNWHLPSSALLHLTTTTNKHLHIPDT